MDDIRYLARNDKKEETMVVSISHYYTLLLSLRAFGSYDHIIRAQCILHTARSSLSRYRQSLDMYVRTRTDVTTICVRESLNESPCAR